MLLSCIVATKGPSAEPLLLSQATKHPFLHRENHLASSLCCHILCSRDANHFSLNWSKL